MDRERLSDQLDELAAISNALEHLSHYLRKRVDDIKDLEERSRQEEPITWLDADSGHPGLKLSHKVGTFREYAQQELPGNLTHLEWAVERADQLSRSVERVESEVREAMKPLT